MAERMRISPMEGLLIGFQCDEVDCRHLTFFHEGLERVDDVERVALRWRRGVLFWMAEVDGLLHRGCDALDADLWRATEKVVHDAFIVLIVLVDGRLLFTESADIMNEVAHLRVGDALPDWWDFSFIQIRLKFGGNCVAFFWSKVQDGRRSRKEDGLILFHLSLLVEHGARQIELLAILRLFMADEGRGLLCPLSVDFLRRSSVDGKLRREFGECFYDCFFHDEFSLSESGSYINQRLGCFAFGKSKISLRTLCRAFSIVCSLTPTSRLTFKICWIFLRISSFKVSALGRSFCRCWM